MISVLALAVVLDTTIKAPPAFVPRTLQLRAATPPTQPASRQAKQDLVPTIPVVPPLPRVTFNFQLGYQVEQGQVEQGQPGGDGRVATRGDFVLATRGLLTPSLHAYVAGLFYDGTVPQAQASAPIGVPSPYDALNGKALQLRDAYAEVTIAGPFKVRAGRQFHDGIALVPYDGITWIFATRALDVSLYAGQRVTVFGPPVSTTVAGGRMTLNLESLVRAPVSLGLDVLALEGPLAVQASTTIGLAPGIELHGSVRMRGSDVGEWHGELRARLSRTSTVLLTAEGRTSDDWAYDPILASTFTAPGNTKDERSYLNFGKPLPYTRGSLRAGFVAFRNIDVVAFGAFGSQDYPLPVLDITQPPPDQPMPSLWPTYFEGGGQIEGRLERGLNLGATLRRRVFASDPYPMPLTAFDRGELGERGFTEVDGEISYALVGGARRFEANLELFYRVFEERPPDLVDESRSLEGGRLRIDGRLSSKLRIVAEYELTGSPGNHAPDLTNLQAVRLLAEMTF